MQAQAKLRRAQEAARLKQKYERELYQAELVGREARDALAMAEERQSRLQTGASKHSAPLWRSSLEPSWVASFLF